jgi:heparan-alpha-glucosaminide N-acetyltransferase
LFVGAVVVITYKSLLYDIYVPDWEYQTSAPGSTEKHFFVVSTSSFLYAKRFYYS